LEAANSVSFSTSPIPNCKNVNVPAFSLSLSLLISVAGVTASQAQRKWREMLNVALSSFGSG